MHETLPSIRRARIAERLDAGTAVVAASLASEFRVSEDAIRRDLRALATAGRCRRTYGGALPVSPASAPIQARLEEEPTRKRALALAAVRLVRPGQVLFLDSGSTNVALAGVLPDLPGLSVVTNAVPVAAELLRRRPGLRTVLIGGTVDPEVGGCVDAQALAEVQRLSPDLCFLGACALSRQHGVAAFHYADATFKREVLRRSRDVALLVTSAKLETRAPHAIARLDAIGHLVLEHDAPSAALARLAESGAAILVADRPH